MSSAAITQEQVASNVVKQSSGMAGPILAHMGSGVRIGKAYWGAMLGFVYGSAAMISTVSSWCCDFVVVFVWQLG